jgi:hypothetical protein
VEAMFSCHAFLGRCRLGAITGSQAWYRLSRDFEVGTRTAEAAACAKLRDRARIRTSATRRRRSEERGLGAKVMAVLLAVIVANCIWMA